MIRTCDDLFEVMNQIIDGDPDPKLATELELHIASCSACAELWEQMQDTELWLNGLEDEPEDWLPVIKDAPTGMADAAFKRYKATIKTGPTSIFSRKPPGWVRHAASTGIAAAIIGVGIQYGVLQNPNDPVILPEQLIPTNPPTPLKPEQTPTPGNTAAVTSTQPSDSIDTGNENTQATDDPQRKVGADSDGPEQSSGVGSNQTNQGGNGNESSEDGSFIKSPSPDEEVDDVIEIIGGDETDWDGPDVVTEWTTPTPNRTAQPTVAPTQVVLPTSTPFEFIVSTKKPAIVPKRSPGGEVWYTLPPTTRPTPYQVSFETPRPTIRPSTPEPTRPPATAIMTAQPTATPYIPPATPVPTATPRPTIVATPQPTATPTPRPTIVATPIPTATPFIPPSINPMPTRIPTVITPTPEPPVEPFATATPATKVRLSFIVDQCDVKSGQYCAILGSFSGWKVELKYRLEWNATMKRWYRVIEFDSNQSYEYKLVKVDESGKIVEWEKGNNLTINTGTTNREITLTWRK